MAQTESWLETVWEFVFGPKDPNADTSDTYEKMSGNKPKKTLLHPRL